MDKSGEPGLYLGRSRVPGRLSTAEALLAMRFRKIPRSFNKHLLSPCVLWGSLRAWAGGALAPGRLSSSSSQAVTEMLSAQGSTCHAGTVCGFSRGLAKLQIPSSQGGSNPGSVRHPGAVGSMLGSQGHAGPACSTPVSPPSAYLLGSPQMWILLATSPLTRCCPRALLQPPCSLS